MKKTRKRKFITLGIFSKKIYSGVMIENSKMRSIYKKLKNLGFVETKWQYVFDGQVGGLVKPHNKGGNEIHVRFYKDRIFAEYEIGRVYVLHFFGPRLNANRYLKKWLKGRACFSKDENEYLVKMMCPDLYRVQEEKMKGWKGDTDPHTKWKVFDRILILSLVFLFDWKFLFVLLLIISLFTIGLSLTSTIITSICVSPILMFFPSKNRF